MKYDPQTALLISYRGHDRLVRDISEGKYKVERLGRGYYRFTKLDGTEYETRVYIFPHDRSDFRVVCTCPFSKEGDENPYCKHGIEAKSLLDWEEIFKDTRPIIAEVLAAQRKREEEAENTHYDNLADEYALIRREQQQGGHWVAGVQGDSRMAKRFAHPADDYE